MIKQISNELDEIREKIGELADRMKNIETTKPKTVKRPARVGERILITNACTQAHFGQTYKNGDILTVRRVEVIGKGEVYVEEYPGLIDYREYEVIIETDSRDTFSTGDYVKVIGKTYYNDIKSGEYAKVTDKVDDAGFYKIELIDEPGWDFAHPEDLEKVELSESDIKLIKLGRKPGEYKKGDIVRFTECTGAHDYPEGSIAEIKSEVIEGVFTFGIGYAGRTSWIELVTPVESRLDIND